MSPTSRVRILFVICLLSWGAVAPALAARQNSPAVDSAVNDVERAFKMSAFQKAHPEFKITRDGNSIVISFHPKAWTVYGSDMRGEWSKTPHNETGPDSDGLVVTVSAVDLKDGELEQFAGRAVGLDLREFEANDRAVGNMHIIRHPYWSVYCCGQDYLKRGITLAYNIAFNNRTDHKLLREAFAPLATSLAGAIKRPPAHAAR